MCGTGLLLGAPVMGGAGGAFLEGQVLPESSIKGGGVKYSEPFDSLIPLCLLKGGVLRRRCGMVPQYARSIHSVVAGA